MSKIQPVELREFVEKAIREIEDAADLKKRSLGGPIEFEVTVLASGKQRGGFKMYVLNAGVDRSRESTAKIKFSVHPHYPRERVAEALKEVTAR